MGLILLIVVLVVLVLGAAIAFVLLRRSPQAPTAVIEPEPAEDPEMRAARHRAIDERGSELLDRRVDLDMRRGTLAGDSQAYDAFDHLEARFRAGEISEDEYEAGKVRILGG